MAGPKLSQWDYPNPRSLRLPLLFETASKILAQRWRYLADSTVAQYVAKQKMVVETFRFLNDDASFAYATNKNPRRAFYIVCEKLYAVCCVVTTICKAGGFCEFVYFEFMCFMK